MMQRHKDLGAREPKVSIALTALVAVVLMVGLSQTRCIVEALLGAVLRAAMGLLPEVLLDPWLVLRVMHSSGSASVCQEVARIAGSWWPTLATLLMKI